MSLSLRDVIAGYLVSRARNPGLNALHEKGNTLFRLGLHQQWSEFPGLRNETPGLFPMTKEIRFNCGMSGTRSISLYETAEEKTSAPLLAVSGLAVPYKYYDRYGSNAFVPSEELRDLIVAHTDEVTAYINETKELLVQTKATLMRMSNVNKFKEFWPEAYEAAEHLIPERPDAPTLPVKMDVLNSALDLPVE